MNYINITEKKEDEKQNGAGKQSQTVNESGTALVPCGNPYCYDPSLIMLTFSGILLT